MKQISISDSAYRALCNDAKRRKLKLEELIEIIFKREYQLK